MPSDGRQNEGVNLEAVICSVHTKDCEAPSKVHNDREERRVPISKALTDTGHSKERL